ncbi:MAG: hypothetical protein ACT4N1_05530 [Nitrososphaerota archaeon]
MYKAVQMISGIIFALLLLPSVAYAEKIPDYFHPYAPISTDKQVYSWTDKVHITIAAPSWNENRYGIDSIGDIEGYFIKISTTGHELEPYRLVETAPNSGIFVGEVILTGFSHDATGDGQIDTHPRTIGAGPSSGFLEADRDDGLTISFEFADGVVLTQNVRISWNQAEINFDKTSYLPDEIVKVQIMDPDMNLNPESADTISVEVSSDSDSAGITVDTIETKESSGVFEATISLTQTGVSSGNRLHAIPDDMIYAKYEDNTLPSPYSINDSLDVVADSVLISQTHILEKVAFGNTILADNLGIPVQDPKAGQQLQVVSEIQNKQSYEQPFVYLVQVKDSTDTVVWLSWFKGSLAINQRLDVSQSWLPLDGGTYTVETFVWKSIANSSPLAPSLASVYEIKP